MDKLGFLKLLFIFPKINQKKNFGIKLDLFSVIRPITFQSLTIEIK